MLHNGNKIFGHPESEQTIRDVSAELVKSAEDGDEQSLLCRFNKMMQRAHDQQIAHRATENSYMNALDCSKRGSEDFVLSNRRYVGAGEWDFPPFFQWSLQHHKIDGGSTRADFVSELRGWNFTTKELDKFTGDGFYFWDETETQAYGPFKTLTEAVQQRELYCRHLNQQHMEERDGLGR